MRYACDHLPSNYQFINRYGIEIPEDGVIRWHVVNFTEKMQKHEVLLAFTQAIDKWQVAFDQIRPVGRYLTLEPTPYFDKAQIKIFFCKKDHSAQRFIVDTSEGAGTYTLDCPFAFDGEQGTLAHAFPINVSKWSGHIHLDEDEWWSKIHKIEDERAYSSRMRVHLGSVFMHEMGHVFVLDHTDVVQAVMAAMYTGVKQELHLDDQLGLSERWKKTKEIVAKSQGWQPPRLTWWRRLLSFLGIR